MPLRAAHPTYWKTPSNTLLSTIDAPLTLLTVQLVHSSAELSCSLLTADTTTIASVRKGNPYSPRNAVSLQTSRFATHISINFALLPLERATELRLFLSNPTPNSNSTLIFTGATSTEPSIPLGELHLPPLPSNETPHLEILRLTPQLPHQTPSFFDYILHTLTLLPLPLVPFTATLPLSLTQGPVFYSPQQPPTPLYPTASSNIP